MSSLFADLPRDVTVRPATEADLPAIVELVRLSEQATIGEPYASLGQFRVLFDANTFNTKTDSWLLFSEHDQLLAQAMVIRRSESRCQVVCITHPTLTQSEHVRWLLEQIEVRGRAWLSDVAPDIRFYLSAIFYAQQQDLIEQFRQQQYEHVRDFYYLRRDLAGPLPEPHWPEGVRITTVSGPEQYPLLHQIMGEIFQDHWGISPQPYEQWLKYGPERADGNFDPSLWFLPMVGDEIVGVCLCRKVGELVNLDEVGIRRPWRKQGIALAMLHHAFRVLSERGFKDARVMVDARNPTGATRLYKRAGMHVYRHMPRYEKTLQAGRELETR